ncbi:MAG: flagellar basal body P-ring protein FlgI [Leptospiraceae bacterium]|nr:flagellar basal body P-ring protein FlgI [Leptospiraceae bacterium]MCP5493270.1 flagellar basal body P-ring protein FlgI [Leptospiraceae bacterium]
MKKKLIFLLLFIAIWEISPIEVKLKDIARIEGIRQNQLSGYGIVAGLPGTGDTQSSLTTESMKNYLKNLGLDAGGNLMKSRNIASVLVTANVSTYAKTGDKIDVTVSSIGDARSLEGGVLLQAPLKAANNEVYAVASGVISFGGQDKTYRGRVSRVSQKTAGLIYGGGIVEKEILAQFFPDTKFDTKFKVILEDQDFTTLNNIQKAIQESRPLQEKQVKTEVVSPTEIDVLIPKDTESLPILAVLGELIVEPGNKARVVINERTGTIVMGGNIVVDEVAIAKQGLKLVVTNKRRIFYDEPVEESNDKLIQIKEATSVSDVVDALGKIGATTKDVIAILEGLKKAGALHAEVIVQ